LGGLPLTRLLRATKRARLALALGGLVAAVSTLAPAATAAPAQHADATALGALVSLRPDEAAARLSTLAGVISTVAKADMAIGAHALGVGPTGSLLLYGRAPHKAPKQEELPPKPTLQCNNSLCKDVYEHQLAEWADKKAASDAVADANARSWAQRLTANLLNTTVRSPDRLLTTQDLSVGLFRFGQFAAAAGGKTVLLIIADRLPPPPANSFDYGLAGVHAILAGWKTDHPAEFQTRAAQWRGFLRSQQAEPDVKILPRGTDRTDDIVSAVKRALS
jgi:hypothetical protein